VGVGRVSHLSMSAVENPTIISYVFVFDATTVYYYNNKQSRALESRIRLLHLQYVRCDNIHGNSIFHFGAASERLRCR
jgi:nitroimidazol reductase NimA-like FMN-containing flavoprotein (pyridoxamine 5'-phosphate oxidase superfamily)